MSKDIFYELLSRKLANEASEQELHQLTQIIDSNPEWKKIYLLFVSGEQNKNEEDSSKSGQAFVLHSLKLHLAQEHLLTDKQPSLPQLNSSGARWITASKYTLLLVGFITLSVLGYNLIVSSFRTDSADRTQVVTKKGSKTNVKLPDGSSVWINSDSRLQYANNFKGKLREVWLDGEAYFDVTKDVKHPFVIHTDKINIRVLGTAFNVKNYSNDKVIETSLLRGKIEVSFNDRPQGNIILRPNEKLTVNKNTLLQRDEISAPEKEPKIKLDNLVGLNESKLVLETAWMDNKIAFSNCLLSDVAHMLERRYSVKVDFKDPDVMNYRYTGIFDDENLDDILKIMQISKPFNYVLNGKKLMITQ